MKAPRLLLPDLYAFSPNRETLGGTAYYFIKKNGNILVDSPPWCQESQDFFHAHGGIRWFYLTHRGAISKHIQAIQTIFDCEIIIQEQEAYLLPSLNVTTFGKEITFSDAFQGLWTPGFSPGSSCLYHNSLGGILFSGRHLLPDHHGQLTPLKIAKTFHWQRQLKSVQLLCDRFDENSLQYVFPATNTGFLRGQGFVRDAYKQIKIFDGEITRSKIDQKM